MDQTGTGATGPEPTSSGTAGAPAGAGARFALGLVLVLAFAFHLLTALHVNRKEVTDFRTFYEASRALWDGGDPYAVVGHRWPYLYPPTFIWALGPVAALPAGAAVALWTAILFGAWVGSMILVRRLTRLEGGPAGLWAIVLPGLLTYRFVLRSTRFGQVDLLVFLLVAAALLALARRRDLVAGLLLAGATVIKMLPVILAVVLVARGRWRALAGFVAGGALFMLVPIAGLGPGRYADVMRLWLGGALVSHASNIGYDNDPANQSLSATMNRLLAAPEGSGVDGPGQPVARWPLARVGRTWAILAGAILVVTVLILGSHRLPGAVALEGSFAYLLLHLVSRKTWETHLVSLILVYASLLAASSRIPAWRRAVLGGVTLSAILINGYAPVFAGSASDWLQFHGPTTLALGILWGTCGTLLVRSRRPEQAIMPAGAT